MNPVTKLLVTVLLLLPLPLFAKEAKQIQLPDATLASSEGTRLSLQDLRGETATVLVFMSIECPISNGYTPTLCRIDKQYGEQGLKVIGLNPNKSQSLRKMLAHGYEYEIRFPLLKDAGAELAKQFEVKVCPEVFLFDAKGKLVYRGRVDDRYVRRGGAAKQVQSNDLENAIQELLSGKAITTARTEPLGCPVELPIAANTNRAPNAEVTYSRDVAPILQQHCQECHRPNGIGPFSLTTYEAAVRWAEDIVYFTEERLMPPWKVAEGHGDFISERTMPKEQIEQLAKWVELGCPQGEAKQPVQSVSAKAENTWRMGQPDAVFEIPESYTVSAEGTDDYRCFVIPTEFLEDKYIVGIDVQPGNRRVVHHVIAFLDDSGAARGLDQRDAGPGYSSLGGFPGFLPSGFLGGWAPGNMRAPLPAGMAKVLPTGSDIVLQVHYHKTGKEETDRTKIGLYFNKKPINRVVNQFAVSPIPGPFSPLRIPAGESDYRIASEIVLPEDVLLVSVTPHMHLLGQQMKLTATKPNGEQVPLVWVKDWDFNWQETYQYRQPVALPKGTKIDLEAHYDNSTDNPYNPNRPPKLVTWGENTDDEMCLAFFEFVTQEKVDDPADLRPMTQLERLRFNLQARQSMFDGNPAQEFLMKQLLRARVGNERYQQLLEEGVIPE